MTARLVVILSVAKDLERACVQRTDARRLGTSGESPAKLTWLCEELHATMS